MPRRTGPARAPKLRWLGIIPLSLELLYLGRCHLSCVRNTADQPFERTLERDFAGYLIEQRGLSRETLTKYRRLVRRFLAKRSQTGVLRVNRLAPPDISQFILQYSRTASGNSVYDMATALRAFFSFLFLTGRAPTDLGKAVPAVANRRSSGSLPRWIEWAHVERLLTGFDRRTRSGRRNYAMMLLLARLGLRGGEVADMTLDDLDWGKGELVVRGKGGKDDRMPIPRDVGAAIAAYLRHSRPQCSTRRVFIRLVKPFRGLGSYRPVSGIVSRALEHARVRAPIRGAHLLRHSLATEMLRKGASLAEVGQVLRHRSPDTTAVYAKVDFARLRALVQCWPGELG